MAVDRTLDYVQQHYPYWNASSGSDHLWIITQDHGYAFHSSTSVSIDNLSALSTRFSRSRHLPLSTTLAEGEEVLHGESLRSVACAGIAGFRQESRCRPGLSIQ